MKSSDTKKEKHPLWLTLLALGVLGAVGIGALLVVLVAVENHRGTRKWNEYCAQLEAKGEKLEMRAYVDSLPVVAASNNFASLELVSEVFYNYKRPPGSVRLWAIRTTAADYEHNKKDPPKNTDRVKKSKMELWASYYLNHTNYPQADATATPAKRVITALNKFEPELKELRESAIVFPECQFPLDYIQNPTQLALPHLAVFKGIMQVLNLRALAYLEEGNADAAFEDIKLGLFMMDTLKRDPILISHLVRNSFYLLINEAFQDGLRRHCWREAHLAWFQQFYERHDFLSDYLFCMRGERNFGIAAAKLINTGGARDVLGSIPEHMVMAYRLIPDGFMNHSLYHIVRLHQDYTLSFVSPEKHRVYPEKVRQFDREMAVTARSYYGILARLLVPAVAKAPVSFAQFQAMVDAGAIACAVERFRLAEGKIPETLETLTPKFLQKIPNDIIGGKPLKYIPIGDDEFRIYSLGWNGKDENGTASADREKGDWGIFVDTLPEKAESGEKPRRFR